MAEGTEGVQVGKVPCGAAWPAKINVYLVRHSERADEVKDVAALQNASQKRWHLVLELVYTTLH